MPYPYDLSAPAQSLREALNKPTPLGLKHLHYARRDGEGRWVVRTRRNSLCGTPRCRKVWISMVVPGDEVSNPQSVPGYREY